MFAAFTSFTWGTAFTAFTSGAVVLGLPHEAHAFPGLLVGRSDAKLEAHGTEVVLMREGTRTVVSMRSTYAGPAQDFALVIPVPPAVQKDSIRTLPGEVFDHLDELDAPRLVESWEQDPCARHGSARSPSNSGAVARGLDAGAKLAAPARSGESLEGTTVEAHFTTGEYDVTVLVAKDATTLDAWMRREGYKLPTEGRDGGSWRIHPGGKFLVARVDADKLKFQDGSHERTSRRAILSPLRFHYDAPELGLLGLPLLGERTDASSARSSGPALDTQELVVHVLDRGHRYVVAGSQNVVIPTNLDLAEAAKKDFGAFYAALFDRTLDKAPKAIVTEYVGDAATCDSCPRPPLSDAELVMLGADVLPSVSSELDLVDPQLREALGGGDASPVSPTSPAASVANGPRALPSARRTYYGLRSFVLTRLHARRAPASLTEDMVFETAPPIVGGREKSSAGAGAADSARLEQGASPSSTSAFQARYVVRHAWAGPTTCSAPVSGVWGAPPNGLSNGPPKAATGLAFADRDRVHFASLLRSDVKELGIVAEGTPPSGSGGNGPSEGATATERTAGGFGASSVSSTGGAGAEARVGELVSSPGGSKRGCSGCATAPERSGARDVYTLSFACAALALTLARRRRLARASGDFAQELCRHEHVPHGEAGEEGDEKDRPA